MRWLTVTPFGRPVDPDVYITYAACSAATTGSGTDDDDPTADDDGFSSRTRTPAPAAGSASPGAALPSTALPSTASPSTASPSTAPRRRRDAPSASTSRAPLSASIHPRRRSGYDGSSGT